MEDEVKKDSLNVKNVMKSTKMKMALWDIWELYMKEDSINVKNAMKSKEKTIALGTKQL